MAERAGVTQSEIARIESGRARTKFPTLHRILAGTGLELHFRLDKLDDRALLPVQGGGGRDTDIRAALVIGDPGPRTAQNVTDSVRHKPVIWPCHEIDVACQIRVRHRSAFRWWRRDLRKGAEILVEVAGIEPASFSPQWAFSERSQQ